MSHILSWVFKVSGLQASEGFAFMGNSPAGVDYYDVRATTFSARATCSTIYLR